MPSAYIIDDHYDTCEVLKLALESSSFKVATFNSFDEALPHAIAEEPCVAFIDLHVPGKLGAPDFIREVRRVHPNLKIIAVSGSSKVGVISGEIGADGFLIKPFDISEIVRTTEQHCPKT